MFKLILSLSLVSISSYGFVPHGENAACYVKLAKSDARGRYGIQGGLNTGDSYSRVTIHKTWGSLAPAELMTYDKCLEKINTLLDVLCADPQKDQLFDTYTIDAQYKHLSERHQTGGEQSSGKSDILEWNKQKFRDFSCNDRITSIKSTGVVK